MLGQRGQALPRDSFVGSNTVSSRAEDLVKLLCDDHLSSKKRCGAAHDLESIFDQKCLALGVDTSTIASMQRRALFSDTRSSSRLRSAVGRTVARMDYERMSRETDATSSNMPLTFFAELVLGCCTGEIWTAWNVREVLGGMTGSLFTLVARLGPTSWLGAMVQFLEDLHRTRRERAEYSGEKVVGVSTWVSNEVLALILAGALAGLCEAGIGPALACSQRKVLCMFEEMTASDEYMVVRLTCLKQCGMLLDRVARFGGAYWSIEKRIRDAVTGRYCDGSVRVRALADKILHASVEEVRGTHGSNARNCLRHSWLWADDDWEVDNDHEAHTQKPHVIVPTTSDVGTETDISHRNTTVQAEDVDNHAAQHDEQVAHARIEGLGANELVESPAMHSSHLSASSVVAETLNQSLDAPTNVPHDTHMEPSSPVSSLQYSPAFVGLVPYPVTPVALSQNAGILLSQSREPVVRRPSPDTDSEEDLSSHEYDNSGDHGMLNSVSEDDTPFSCSPSPTSSSNAGIASYASHVGVKAKVSTEGSSPRNGSIGGSRQCDPIATREKRPNALGMPDVSRISRGSFSGTDGANAAGDCTRSSVGELAVDDVHVDTEQSSGALITDGAGCEPPSSPFVEDHPITKYEEADTAGVSLVNEGARNDAGFQEGGASVEAGLREAFEMVLRSVVEQTSANENDENDVVSCDIDAAAPVDGVSPLKSPSELATSPALKQLMDTMIEASMVSSRDVMRDADGQGMIKEAVVDNRAARSVTFSGWNVDMSPQSAIAPLASSRYSSCTPMSHITHPNPYETPVAGSSAMSSHGTGTTLSTVKHPFESPLVGTDGVPEDFKGDVAQALFAPTPRTTRKPPATPASATTSASIATKSSTLLDESLHDLYRRLREVEDKLDKSPSGRTGPPAEAAVEPKPSDAVEAGGPPSDARSTHEELKVDTCTVGAQTMGGSSIAKSTQAESNAVDASTVAVQTTGDSASPKWNALTHKESRAVDTSTIAGQASDHSESPKVASTHAESNAGDVSTVAALTTDNYEEKKLSRMDLRTPSVQSVTSSVAAAAQALIDTPTAKSILIGLDFGRLDVDPMVKEVLMRDPDLFARLLNSIPESRRYDDAEIAAVLRPLAVLVSDVEAKVRHSLVSTELSAQTLSPKLASSQQGCSDATTGVDNSSVHADVAVQHTPEPVWRTDMATSDNDEYSDEDEGDKGPLVDEVIHRLLRYHPPERHEEIRSNHCHRLLYEFRRRELQVLLHSKDALLAVLDESDEQRLRRESHERFRHSSGVKALLNELGIQPSTGNMLGSREIDQLNRLSAWRLEELLASPDRALETLRGLVNGHPH